MNPIYVHTLGDSTLDNVYWMLDEQGKNIEEAKAQSVEGQIQAKLQEDNDDLYQVISHAYDGFTTNSLIDGDDVGSVLRVRPQRVDARGLGYLKCKDINSTDDSFFVSPISKLKNEIEAHPDSTHYIVMSVCGNDFRVQITTPIKMLKSIPEILERYNFLLNELVELKGMENRDIKPILMFQYRVDANNDGYGIYNILKIIGAVTLTISLLSAAALITSLTALAGLISAPAAIILALIGIGGLILSHQILPLRMTAKVLSGEDLSMATLDALLERFYQPILQRAKDEEIPILDLPNTFNPYKPLYLASIEPGVEGGALIAEGIDHIIKNHDFNSASMLYAKNDSQAEYAASENPGYDGWRVSAAQRP
ncbi:MAG: hypothetical protein H0T62_11970 [Parachlamydiaceae bacterium]|nr:hypothetical protein [Parachlamydiaceae bacterium]